MDRKEATRRLWRLENNVCPRCACALLKITDSWAGLFGTQVPEREATCVNGHKTALLLVPLEDLPEYDYLTEVDNETTD